MINIKKYYSLGISQTRERKAALWECVKTWPSEHQAVMERLLYHIHQVSEFILVKKYCKLHYHIHRVSIRRYNFIV